MWIKIKPGKIPDALQNSKLLHQRNVQILFCSFQTECIQIYFVLTFIIAITVCAIVFV